MTSLNRKKQKPIQYIHDDAHTKSKHVVEVKAKDPKDLPNMNLVFLGTETSDAHILHLLLLEKFGLTANEVERHRRRYAQEFGYNPEDLNPKLPDVYLSRYRSIQRTFPLTCLVWRRFITENACIHAFYPLFSAPKAYMKCVTQSDLAMIVFSIIGEICLDNVLLAMNWGLQIFICVTDMDLRGIIDYKEEEFEKWTVNFYAKMKKLGFAKTKFIIIPCAIVRSENVLTKSDKMKWYDGECIANVLNRAVPIRKYDVHGRFRMPIMAINRMNGVGTVLIGQMQSGMVNVSDVVEFGAKKQKYNFKVKSIERSQEYNNIRGGDWISVCIATHKGVTANTRTIKRSTSCILTLEDQGVPLVHSFTCQVGVADVSYDINIPVGRRLQVFTHVLNFPANVKCIISQIDSKGNHIGESFPKKMGQLKNYLVEFLPHSPQYLVKISESLRMGRVAFKDDKNFIAFGSILHVYTLDDHQRELERLKRLDESKHEIGKRILNDIKTTDVKFWSF